MRQGAVVLAAVAGLGVGFAAGLALAPTAEEAARTSPAAAPTPGPTAEAAPRRRTVEPGRVADPAACEGEVAELRAAVEDLEERLADETLGVAARWTDEVPEHLAPAGFDRQVRKAVEACDAGGDLVDVDCREPPCFAVFRVRSQDWWDRFVNQCPDWVDVYGPKTTMIRGDVDCGDGRTERILLLGAADLFDHVERPRPDDPWNETKRMNTRKEDAAGSWACLPPG